jgi:predicted DNA-binding protein with PD1-like motif
MSEVAFLCTRAVVYRIVGRNAYNGMEENPMGVYTFRLKSGLDLIEEIHAFVKDKKIEAGCVLSAVGSLTHATLRLANREVFSEYEGHFEIVSMTGTVSIHGSHLHISISDGDGKTFGGHLVPGCRVFTTVEMVIMEFEDVAFRREYAQDSGYEELVVKPK